MLRQDDGCIVGPDNYRFFGRKSLDRSSDGERRVPKSHDSLGHLGFVFDGDILWILPMGNHHHF